ncbi:glutamate racemase [Chthonomonas calidirosea]|uniref:glutamate racemase n=1 Tax=Chthonomonas calidirosea TaxID=454171 RepID=UPI0006DD4DD7|nr:glutamate racemase [Chthonomonas calidirosea]CEK19719.1 glutamate racemase [Chthonomonas calidirosea]
MSVPFLGVFDSGVGGLTVVHALRKVAPRMPIWYVADQAHVPYGGRPLEEVRAFACGISEALLAKRDGVSECVGVVMACNISSAVALPVVQAKYPHVPVLGMVEPGVRAAVKRTRNGRIGVLATEGTVQSGAYRQTLGRVAPDVEVYEVACPAFVPLVEAGAEGSEAAREAACRYLHELESRDVDTVILGCTHYPFLLPLLRRLSPQFVYVDPAEPTAEMVGEKLSSLKTPDVPRHQLFTTGDVGVFQAQLERLFPDLLLVSEVKPAWWDDGQLLLG